MDLLSQRYANPYLILDDFIRLNQLHDFVYEVMKTISDENIKNARWEYYLHRIFDMSFEDYVYKCEIALQEKKKISKNEFNEIISDSQSMLEGFKPE